jgi:hypothetical protein
MDWHMEGKPLGLTNSLHGKLDGVPYDLFVMKDKDCNIKLMSMYGSLVEQGENKQRALDNGTTVTFKYQKPLANHFAYWQAVGDDHNNQHLVTHHWKNRVFAFILAVTEINTLLVMQYFVWSPDKEEITKLKFQKQLAKELIYNNDFPKGFDEEEEHQGKQQHCSTGHDKIIMQNNGCSENEIIALQRSTRSKPAGSKAAKTKFALLAIAIQDIGCARIVGCSIF